VAAVSAAYRPVVLRTISCGVVFAETGLVVTTICPATRCCSRPGPWPPKGLSRLWALYPGFCPGAFAGDTAA
jgi:hypothetical protein